MRTAMRPLCLAIGLAVFAWMLSHARIFTEYVSRVHPNPPPLYLVFVGAFTAVLLWLYAFEVTEVPSAPQRYAGGGVVPLAERPEPLEPAGPVSSGDSSPLAR